MISLYTGISKGSLKGYRGGPRVAQWRNKQPNTAAYSNITWSLVQQDVSLYIIVLFIGYDTMQFVQVLLCPTNNLQSTAAALVQEFTKIKQNKTINKKNNSVAPKRPTEHLLLVTRVHSRSVRTPPFLLHKLAYFAKLA